MPSRATASGERLAMLLPANAILPLRLTVPDTARSVVVLPAPFGPRTATSSPSPTSSETPCSARIWPYRASTSSSSSRELLGIRPEVGLDHRRVVLHLARRAARDPAAEVEHVHAVGDTHHQLHVVLDQQDRQLEVLAHPADQRAELSDLLVVQASRRLVQEQQPRPRCERAGKLDAFLGAEGELARRPIGEGGQADIAEDLAGAPAAARVPADQHMLEHRHRAEQLDVLEGARDPAADDAVRRRAQQAAPVEDDLAVVRPVEPRDQVEDRRLAGAVRPDQPDDLALTDVERDAVDGNDPAEAPRQLLDRKQGHGGGP